MLKYMLDTNICIYVIKRKPLEAMQAFNLHVGQLCISSITLAELLHGAAKSAKSEHNLRVVEDFVSRLDILDYGDKAASHYADVRADLERKGTPMGVNDLHIAGHARSEALIIVTNNEKVFVRVDGLRVENWI